MQLLIPFVRKGLTEGLYISGIGNVPPSEVWVDETKTNIISTSPYRVDLKRS